jgi:CDP-4-dehydro-6-deoxyglucose reductase
MVMIYTASGLRFEQIDKESILDSAEKMHVSLPHSCRDGRCGSCKCKVLSGETECLSQELSLTDEQSFQGWILSCVRIATTDVELDVEDLGGFKLIKPKTLPCKIDSITQVSSEVVKLVLRLPPSSNVEYYAGQYFDIIVDNIKRSYSIANAPNNVNHLEIHVKKVELGLMSRYWFEGAKKDDLLRINGPLGTFFLRDVAKKDLVFFATGTGIAPVKSMLETLNGKCKSERPDSVSVFWGGRTLSDLYWDPTECSYPMRYVPVLSRPPEDWLGCVGYIQDAFMRMSPDLTKTLVYACGSDAMIGSASEVLSLAGLAEGRFYSDAFLATGLN